MRSSSQRLMRFSASRRVASIHSRFSSGFRFSDRSRSSPAILFFFFLRRALFLQFFFLRFFALRVRQALWSQRPRVDAALRFHHVSARQTDPSLRQRGRIQLAAIHVSASSVAHAAAFCCCRSDPAVPHCRCRSDSADLPAAWCTPCTKLRLLSGIQLSGVRLRTRARLQYL